MVLDDQRVWPGPVKPERYWVLRMASGSDDLKEANDDDKEGESWL